MTRATGFGAALDLDGARALVTGASGNIGAVIARRLAERGAFVIVHYCRHEAGAREVCAAIERTGGRSRLAKANLAEPSQVGALFADVGEGGGLDILVHSAAIGSFKNTIDVRPNQWDLSLAVNARALLVCAQQAVPLMRGRRGRIVSVSSLGSTRVVPEYGAIGVSKAALESLTRYLAVELAPRAIHVNAVSAGLVDGPTIRRHPQYARLHDQAVARSPTGRLTSAEDVAGVVLFLCSPLADSILGQTIVVDGGLSLAL
jgi:enoyl-[acyl-carrier protein] reductase III